MNTVKANICIQAGLVDARRRANTFTQAELG